MLTLDSESVAPSDEIGKKGLVHKREDGPESLLTVNDLSNHLLGIEFNSLADDYQRNW